MSQNQVYPDSSGQEQSALDFCNQADEWLNQLVPPFDEVERALLQSLNLLGDDKTPEANNIRQRVGELWIKLIELMPDLENARNSLREAERVLIDQTILNRLREIHNLVELGLRVQDDLSAGKNKGWPDWFERSDGRSRLTGILERLDSLEGAGSWPVIRQKVSTSRQALISEFIPEYILSLYRLARQESRSRNFAQAARTVDAAIKFTPESLRLQLPPEGIPDDIYELRDALESRQKAEVTLWNAVNRLMTENLSFREFHLSSPLSLPSNPDVPIDDLETLLDDIQHATNIETALKGLESLSGGVTSIYRLQPLVGTNFAIQKNLPDFLKNSDPYLAQRLQKRFIDLQNKPIHAINDAIETLIERIKAGLLFRMPDADPSSMINDLWQIRWCLASGAILDPKHLTKAENIVSDAQKGPRALANRAAAFFYEMRDIDTLEYLKGVLESLRKLNLGLVYIPVQEDQNGSDFQLPPLPEGVFFPERTPPIDESAVESWIKIIENWLAIFEGPLYQEEGAIADPRGIQPIGVRANSVLQDLATINEEIWPKLELENWEIDSSLGLLESEARIQQKLVSILEEAESKWYEMRGMERVLFLDDETARGELKDIPNSPPHWLLEKERTILVEVRNAMRLRAVEETGQQISSILKDQSSAIEIIRAEILSKPNSIETARVAYDSILSSTNQLVEKALKEDAKEESTSYWQIIEEAARSWTDEQNKAQSLNNQSREINDLWNQLQREARRNQLRTSVASRRRLIAGAIIVVTLILVGGIGAYITLVLPQVRANRAAIANVTATANAKITQTVIEQQIQATSTAATATAFVEIQQTATVQAIFSATAQEATAQVLGATATAESLSMTATAEVIRCMDVASYGLEILSGPELSPEPGTPYVIGGEPYPITATWEVRNSGSCDWTKLDIKPFTGEQETSLSIMKDGEIYNITNNNPLEVGDSVIISLTFESFFGPNLNDDWVLSANDLTLDRESHLTFEGDTWIVLVTPVVPPPTRP